MHNLFVHEALFYRDGEDFLAGTTPFILNAVVHEEPVLVAVPEPNIALLRRHLGSTADDVSFLDMTEAGRNPGRIIPAVLMAFSANTPHAPLRVVGEPIWPGRSDLEYPACVQHEARINETFAGRRGTILCPYTTELPDHVLHDAQRTHPIVTTRSTRRRSAHYTEPEKIRACFNVPLGEPPEDSQAHTFSVATLALTRRRAERFGVQAGLCRDRVEDLVLAVNELATNSILHARGHGVLRMWCEDNKIVCEVADGAPAGSASTMVNLICDLVRTHTSHKGTTIRVYFGK